MTTITIHRRAGAPDADARQAGGTAFEMPAVDDAGGAAALEAGLLPVATDSIDGAALAWVVVPE
ncbi:MAG: hypothetical protein ACR2N6_01135, partial [Miltoncostaeaceae bacterium]